MTSVGNLETVRIRRCRGIAEDLRRVDRVGWLVALNTSHNALVIDEQLIVVVR